MDNVTVYGKKLAAFVFFLLIFSDGDDAVVLVLADTCILPGLADRCPSQARWEKRSALTHRGVALRGEYQTSNTCVSITTVSFSYANVNVKESESEPPRRTLSNDYFLPCLLHLVLPDLQKVSKEGLKELSLVYSVQEENICMLMTAWICVM